MNELPGGSTEVTDQQSRLVIETLSQIVAGAEIVEIVATSNESIVGIVAEGWTAPGAENARAHIQKRVRSLLESQTDVSSFSCVVSGAAWGVLVEPIQVGAGSLVGALVVARQGRAWSSRERS